LITDAGWQQHEGASVTDEVRVEAEFLHGVERRVVGGGGRGRLHLTARRCEAGAVQPVEHGWVDRIGQWPGTSLRS
jgi:hypothetical protein